MELNLKKWMLACIGMCAIFAFANAEAVGGPRLEWRHPPSGIREPKRVVVFVGGLGEGSDTYRSELEFAASKGLSAVSYIQRLEEDPYVGGSDLLLEDLDSFIRDLHSRNWKVDIVAHSMASLTVLPWYFSTADAGELVESLSFTNPMLNYGNFLTNETAGSYSAMIKSGELTRTMPLVYRYGSLLKSRDIFLERSVGSLKVVGELSAELAEPRINRDLKFVPMRFYVTPTDPNPDHSRLPQLVERMESFFHTNIPVENLAPQGRDHHNPKRSGDHHREYLALALSGLTKDQQDLARPVSLFFPGLRGELDGCQAAIQSMVNGRPLQVPAE